MICCKNNYTNILQSLTLLDSGAEERNKEEVKSIS